jgi:hypothetical protein
MADLLGAIVHFGVEPFVEDDLGDTLTVAQMDEDHLAEISAAMDPTHHDGALSSIFAAQLATVMRAAKVA